MIKKIWKYSNTILTIGLLFQLIENIYFGFNTTAQSHAEKVCDNIVSTILYIGWIGIILIIAILTERTVKNLPDEDSN